jgi:Dyp-type peroxidase family
MSRATTGTRSVTVFARIADGRAADVRERLRAYREESPFAGMAGVHFARLIVLEHAVQQQPPARWTLKARLLDLLAHGGKPQRPDDLPHPYLMMTATVDGDPAAFFRRLQHLGPDADAIWGDCSGYPGHHRQDSFVAFFTDRSVRADYTFSGSPEASVAEITEALRLRRKVAAFAATAPDAADGHLRGRFRTAVDAEETVSDAGGPVAELDLPDIQGLVLRGFGDHHVAAHLFVQITAAGPARRWLRTVAPEVTSAAEVGDRPARALHLGISHAGLTRLEVPAAELATFPEEFRDGMHAREDMLSPGRGTKPWQEPFDAAGAVDIVLLLSATGPDELDPWLARLRAGLAACGGLRVVGEQHGARLTDPERDGGGFVEHFGFADGISQPRVAGHGRRDTPGEVLPPGEFVLGMPDVDGDIAGRHLPPALGRNGSYLVYRKLEQDVPAFRAMTAAAGGGFSGGADDVAAGLVGRRRDGEMLAPCPAGAHVRRANPRGTLPGGSKLTRRHLMLRRGISYGSYLPPGAEGDDDGDRGLLFLAVVGDPGRQFEFVQTEWLADGNVFGRGREEDIFTTAGGTGARILLDGHPPAYVAVPRPLVTCRGGEYFLLPGLAALRALGGDPG